MSRTATGLIVALDTSDRRLAAAWVAAVAPCCGMVKLGLEYFLANGAPGVRALGAAEVFLDLKLHDIPNTVAGAVRAVLPLAPRMLTVHAAGGAAMVEAARRAADSAGAARPLLLAVTVLTSLDANAMRATGIACGLPGQVLRLAKLALEAGADGLVCSAREVTMLREAFGDGPVLVVPGVRPRGAPPGDQVRTMTPREAASCGADWLVVGRPITGAPDPAAAAAAIVADIAA
jgi:orotidine-5'-phosphate decarboxylase